MVGEQTHGHPLLAGLRASRTIHPELCFLTSMAVGFGVVICWGLSMASNGRDDGYQVFEDMKAGDHGLDFWWWHLDNARQWYDTPESACAAFVASHERWKERDA